MQSKRHVVGVEVPWGGKPVNGRARGHGGIRQGNASYNRRGGTADSKSGVSVAILRAGAATLAVTVVVVFAFPDQPRVHRPCGAHEGSLVGGHQRTIDVAGIGEE